MKCYFDKVVYSVPYLKDKLRHEREKLADIELFIAGGALEPMKPASYRYVICRIAFKASLKLVQCYHMHHNLSILNFPVYSGLFV